MKQYSLADAMIVAHDAVKELDKLNASIDWSRIESHLLGIHAKMAGLPQITPEKRVVNGKPFKKRIKLARWL